MKREILTAALLLALPVGVAAQSAPDLEVAFAEVDDSTPVEGGRFTLYVTVGNFGDAESAATTLRYYQSTDATISSADTQVGTDAVGALGVSGISLSQESIDLTAPSTAGTYYYGACVDAVAGESDTTDNCTRRSVMVEVVATTIGSDLVFDRAIRDDKILKPGETFRILVIVRNQGAEWSTRTTVRFYRSTDVTITTSDTEEGSEQIPPLRPLAGVGRTIPLTAPSTAGTYYYGACVDAVSGELDTTNNCSNKVLRVDVEEPDGGGGGGDGGAGDGGSGDGGGGDGGGGDGGSGDGGGGDGGGGDGGSGDGGGGGGDGGAGDLAVAPDAADDVAETPEDTLTVIDVLSNDRDPNGDRLRVASVGPAEHGATAVVSGGVRYAPDLNWHGTDRFTYTVSDPGGLTATARVTIVVLPVNDPPEAVDDEAETLEDEAAIVDVLANDTDVDGAPIRVVAVGSASHGATTMAPRRVRYSPDPNWSGTDRFVYTIADPDGLMATATVMVTVLPINDAPEAVGVIPDQAIEEGGAPVTVDLAPYFTDVEGDVLTYAASSSDETAVMVTVTGATLTLSAVVKGAAAVTVTASDVEGLTATQSFGVQVGDRLVRAVMADTLAALGRGHLSSVRSTIGRHLEMGGSEATRLMVGGQFLSLDAWDRMGAGGLEQTHELLFRAAQLRQRLSATDLVGTSAAPRLGSGPGLMGGAFGGGWDRWLQGTDVLLSFGGQDEQSGRSSEGVGGTRWTVWGQGDLQTFRSAETESEGYDGDLRSGYLGLDARLGQKLLVGAAVARSGGRGDWQVGASSGHLTTALTVVHPYLRWGGRDTSVWALAGIGLGAAENVRMPTGKWGTSPLRLSLGLVEGRRRLATSGGGLSVDLRGEASWARLRTGDGEETVDGLEAGVRRVRAGVEVTLALDGPRGLQVAPFGAVSTRHDGGAGQTGVGLEVAGGVRMTGGRVRVEAQGRMLALHTATDYEERGLSVTASVGAGQYEPGLTASIRPRWGAQGYGAESLWQDQLQSYTYGAEQDDAAVDARVGYGLRLPGGRLLTPFGGYGQLGAGRRMQLGANLGGLGLFGGGLDSPLQVEFVGERYVRPRGRADHRLTLFGIVNLGSRPPRVRGQAHARGR